MEKVVRCSPQRSVCQFKIVGTTVYRGLNSDEVIVLHTFNTGEDAAVHKERMESQPQAHFEEMNAIPPITCWIAEEV